MFFLIDLVSRWFACWDEGFGHAFDLDPLASPDQASPGAPSWSWAAPAPRRVA